MRCDNSNSTLIASQKRVLEYLTEDGHLTACRLAEQCGLLESRVR
jgi:hypothetical protein